MANLYVIAGCNGAGKTTASYTVLPEMLNCKEFVNADSIAAGLSPFKPESVSFEAGRIMLNRISQLIGEKVDFGFETTLSAKSYISLIKNAREAGYEISLLYFWLSSPEFAISRVAERVRMEAIIFRRILLNAGITVGFQISLNCIFRFVTTG